MLKVRHLTECASRGCDAIEKCNMSGKFKQKQRFSQDGNSKKTLL